MHSLRTVTLLATLLPGIAPEIQNFRFASNCKDFEANANIMHCSQYMGTLTCAYIWPTGSKALHELCPTSPSHLSLSHSAPDCPAPASRAFLFKGSTACLASGYLHLQSFLFFRSTFIVGLQHCVSFYRTAKWSAMHIHISHCCLVAKLCLSLSRSHAL